jgi:hypothetical protein
LDKGINVLMFYHNFKLELSPIAGYFCSSFVMVGVAKSYGILMQPLIDEFKVEITTASLGMAVGGGVYTLTGKMEEKFWLKYHKSDTIIQLEPSWW